MATPFAGIGHSQNLVSGVMLDFDSSIGFVDPTDVPLQSGISANGLTVLTSQPCFSTKVDFQDETSLTPRTTLGATCVTAATEVTVASAADRARFGTDDAILVGTRAFRITGYSSDASTYTVAFLAGVSNQQVPTAEVIGIGQAGIEGAETGTARMRDRDPYFNYTQIFGPKPIQISRTEMQIRKHGNITNEFDHQVGQRMNDMHIDFEQALYYGFRTIDTSSGNVRRTMQGIYESILTNVDTVTTSFTENSFLDNMQRSFGAGAKGSNYRVLVGRWAKRAASAFTSQGVMEYVRNDNTRGTVVQNYVSDFGSAQFVLSRWMRKADVIGFEREQAEIAVLTPMIFEMLAKTGDSTKAHIVMEKSLRFHREKHAFKMNALQFTTP